MQKAIIGAGGFAKEVKAWMGNPKISFFVDDNYWTPDQINNDVLPLSKFDPSLYEVLVAIGDPTDRYNMVNKLPKETKYFTIIHHTAQILNNDVYIGEGSAIGPNCVITCNTILGVHTHLNIGTTIGHDTIIGDYFTSAPGVKISGNCNIKNRVYFGSNATVRQKINICDNVTIGLNSGVVKDITESGTYGGVPVKLLKK